MSTLQNTDVFAVTRGTDTYKVSFADVVAGVPIPSVLTYQGTADPAATAPAPAGGLKAGMVYVLTPAGTLEASWTGIGGKHADDGQLAIWEGAKWELVGNTGAIPAASDSVLGLVQLADAAAITAGTATRVVDAAQLKAAVDAENLWDRTGTTLTTKTAGDKVAAAALPAATTTVAGAVQLADAAAVTAGTAGRVVDAAQLKAVSDAATAADEWTRTGTEITPKTAGDKVFVGGDVKVGGTTAAPNIQLKADGQAAFGGILGLGRAEKLQVAGSLLAYGDNKGFVVVNNGNNGGGVILALSGADGGMEISSQAGPLNFAGASGLHTQMTKTGDFLLGGTLPASPNITLKADGRAVFTGSANINSPNGTKAELSISQTGQEVWYWRSPANSRDLALHQYNGAADTQRLRVVHDTGDFRLGGTLPSAPNLTLRASGNINAKGAVSRIYADNTAAKAGGLVDGDIYRTATGQLMIVFT